MNKRVTLFLIITLVILSIFCISVLADYTIPQGTVITFHQPTVNLNDLADGSYNLSFKTNFTARVYSRFVKSNTGLTMYPNSDFLYQTSRQYPWSSGGSNIWTMMADNTVSDVLLQWIVENSDYEIPPPPPDPMDTVYDNGQNFLINTHQNINTIIGFITRNPIITVFTIGIFLISITVGILYRLNNKTTKRKS